MDFSKVLAFLSGVVMLCHCIHAYSLTAAHEVTEPTHVPSGYGHVIDYHAHPRYEFNYGVHDPDTGDVKNQWEARDGDVVRGSYTVHDPDGTIRTVDYTSDKYNGFNAVVKRVGKAYHPKTSTIRKYHDLVAFSHAGGYEGGATQGGVVRQTVLGAGMPTKYGQPEAGSQGEPGEHGAEEEQNPQIKTEDDIPEEPKEEVENQKLEVGDHRGFTPMTDEQYQKDEESIYYLPMNYEIRKYSAPKEANHY